MNGSNFDNLLNEINGKSYKRLNDLEVGKKYLVNDINTISSSYGMRILVTCDDVKFYLPESWNNRLTMNNIMQLLNHKGSLYVLYNGKVALPDNKFKHDIEFKVEQ